MGCGGWRWSQTGPRRARIPEACDEPGIETKTLRLSSCRPKVLICKPASIELPHVVNVPVTQEAGGPEIQQGRCRRTSRMPDWMGLRIKTWDESGQGWHGRC